MPLIPLTGIDAIIARLSSPGERALATEELARMGPSAIPYLVDAARGTWRNAWGASCENEHQIRSGAVIALRKMGAAASEALPALIALLSHPSAPLRRELVHALALIAKGSNEAGAVEQCAAALAQMQNDPDVEVRYEAMCAIRGRVPVREL